MTQPDDPTDRLEALAQRLVQVHEVPVEQRAAVFDQVNRALVAGLDALEGA